MARDTSKPDRAIQTEGWGVAVVKAIRLQTATACNVCLADDRTRAK